MPIPVKYLYVKANPFTHVDENGRPTGACPELFDPKHPRRQWIGARLAADVTKAARTTSATNADGQTVILTEEEAEHDRYFVFDADPDGSPATVKVPNEAYYRQAILNHELFAADEETWRACGMRAGYQAPAVLLAAHAADAVTKHVAHHGEEYAGEIKAPTWQKQEQASGPAADAAATTTPRPSRRAAPEPNKSGEV